MIARAHRNLSRTDGGSGRSVWNVAMTNWRDDRIGSAMRGENPMVLAQMPSGFAVIGDTQFLPGYAVLLASPRVDRLTGLSQADRSRFLLDMSLLGEAIEHACAADGLVRVNYEILGNTDTYLHAHVFPRYAWESAELLSGPVWHYSRDHWTEARYQYDDTVHARLRSRITERLLHLANPEQAVRELPDTQVLTES